MFLSQSGNTAGGHIAGGNIVTNVTSINHSPLSSLYSRLRDKDNLEEYSAKIADKLQHFCAISSDGDVRGLAEKLNSSNRADILVMAKRLKEDVAKLVMRLQTSPIAQDIITLILCKIYTDFIMHVTPAVEAGASRQEVDALVSEKVVNSAMNMLGENDMMLTDADILGFVFFLGGNCHIRWDKC